MVNFSLKGQITVADLGILEPGGGGGCVWAGYNFWGLEIVLMPLYTYYLLL